jgi:hypothetical protein
MLDIEMINNDREQLHKAEILLWTIQQQADLFEMRTGLAPTVFMSYDLFAILVASLKDVVVYRMGKNQTVHTVCGYDLELLHHGTDLLYVGYKIEAIY